MWKLISVSASDSEGRELPPPLGPQPMGFLLFEAERMIGAVGDGRLSLPSNAPSRAFAAYSGKYRFNGEELVTTADSASSPELLTEQVRHISFESPTRMVASPVNTVLGRTGSLKLVWERVVHPAA